MTFKKSFKKLPFIEEENNNKTDKKETSFYQQIVTSMKKGLELIDLKSPFLSPLGVNKPHITSKIRKSDLYQNYYEAQ